MPAFAPLRAMPALEAREKARGGSRISAIPKIKLPR